MKGEIISPCLSNRRQGEIGRQGEIISNRETRRNNFRGGRQGEIISEGEVVNVEKCG